MRSFVLLLIIFTFNGCKNMKELKDSRNNTITISSLMNAQDLNSLDINQLVFNYKQTITGDSSKTFLNMLSDTINYETVSRKCQFIPSHAIKVDDTLRALIEVTYCPRIIFYSGGKEILYDIKNKSPLMEYFTKMKY